MLRNHPSEWDHLFEPLPKCPEHELTLTQDYTCALCHILLEEADIPTVAIAELGASGIPEGVTMHQWNNMTRGQLRHHVKKMQRISDEENAAHEKQPSAEKKKPKRKKSIHTMVKQNCEQCSKSFGTYASQTRRFCNRQCYHDYMRNSK